MKYTQFRPQRQRICDGHLSAKGSSQVFRRCHQSTNDKTTRKKKKGIKIYSPMAWIKQAAILSNTLLDSSNA